jgi:phenylalanyl-tRNA synthetase alpha chain
MMLNKTAFCNIPKSVEDKLNKNLHIKLNHPIEIIKQHIYNHFKSQNKYNFHIFDVLNPIVSTEDNFDKLLIPKDHPARSPSDTYYVNENQVLRTHTSAHQNKLLKEGFMSFLVTGPVYRKDEIDARHYPIFHQMELFTMIDDDIDQTNELKRILSDLVLFLFPKCEYRFNPDYFPFTDPSFEIEVKFNDQWLEILGCGIVQPKILENNGIYNKRAIAAGFGLDRLCMILFNIPDIRYLWVEDDKFLSQFEEGINSKFKPYSVLDEIARDISFWIPNEQLSEDKWLNENNFYELIRDNTNDIIQKVELFDKFYHNKKKKHSRAYRITYRPVDPNLNNPAEFVNIVNNVHRKLGELVSQLALDIR